MRLHSRRGYPQGAAAIVRLRASEVDTEPHNWLLKEWGVLAFGP